MASIIRRFSQVDRERNKGVRPVGETAEAGVEMSINNGDDGGLQASSESFWEVGKFMRTVNRIDNGHKWLGNLRQLIKERADIEKKYAAELTGWSKKWNNLLDKGPEYGTTLGAWRGVLEEADNLSNLHNEVADKLVNNVTVSIKQWQKENYHKSMMHFKETKEMEDQFRKVQRPWEKKLNKVLQSKKDYHNACRTEKSTANQENNARADSAMSADQLKKLQEKLKKCQTDVENTNQKYQASLNDLNGYNAKYMEEMSDVFDKCQVMERKRIDFVKKIMFDIHQCLDLSVDPRYSQVYTDLHTTISNTDADKDLVWWSHNHGKDMLMAWPVFEEYSPDLKPITSNQKKGSQLTSAGNDGITITSIKHNTDNFVPQPQQTSSNNRASTGSQQSRTSYNQYNPEPASSTINNDHTQRQASYDESLNPFGDDENLTHEGEKTNANTNAEIKSIDNAPIPDPTPVSNPFGDDSDLDEQVSQGSGSGPRSGGGDGMMSVPARVLYAYKAEEEDEISAEAGIWQWSMDGVDGGMMSVPARVLYAYKAEEEDEISAEAVIWQWSMVGVDGSMMSVPARVLYAYKAEEEDEIIAEAGDVITRLSEQDDMGWVKALGKDGVEGLIPASYIEDI